MPGLSGPTTKRPRLFDRGFLFSSLTAVLLAACSGSLNTSNQPGTGGGNSGTGGTAACALGSVGASCGWNECQTGAGNCVGTAGTAGIGGDIGGISGDVGGTGGIGGDIGGSGGPGGNFGDIGGTGGSAGSIGGSGGAVGGTGGTMPLPDCPTGAPMYGICFVNDTDVLPLPSYDTGVRFNAPLAATIVDVGTGTPPAQCEIARVFGTRAPTTWWFQARAADNHLWTIGVNGLSPTPVVAKNDSVTLDLEWQSFEIAGFGPPEGHLKVSDGAGTMLLWAWTRGAVRGLPGAFTPGRYTCTTNFPCDVGGREIVVTMNGASATLPWFGAASVGGYYVAIGQYVEAKPLNPNSCQDYFGVGFDAAAAKLPVTAP